MVELITLLEKDDNETSELEEVRFDPIPLGEGDTKTIYAKNVTNQTVHIEPDVTNVSGSGEVELVSYDSTVEPGELGEVSLRAEAMEMDELSGITADITVDAVAVVPPNQKL